MITRNFTSLEQKTIDALIAKLNGEPGFSDIRPINLSHVTGISMHSLRGVLSSLVQKGVVWVCDDRGPTVVHLEPKCYYLHPVWGKDVRSLANCHVTAAMALGHSKAENNERRAEAFRSILESEGIPVPTDEELYAIGVFNGDGSY